MANEEPTEADSPDKRLAIYKRMRDELMKGDKRDKEESQRHKMEELNKKIELLEKANKEKADKQREDNEYEAKKQQDRSKGMQSLFGNIKSFSIDDN